MPRIRLLVAAATFASMSLIGAGTASAAGTIVFNGAPGTGAPPSTLGPFTMTSLGFDAQPLFTNVSAVSAPSGSISFSSPPCSTPASVRAGRRGATATGATSTGRSAP